MLKWICVIVVVWVVHTKAESLFQSQSTRFSFLPTKNSCVFATTILCIVISDLYFFFILETGIGSSITTTPNPFHFLSGWRWSTWSKTESREFSLVLPGGNQDQPTIAKKTGQQTLWGEIFDVLRTSNDVCMRSAMSILYTCVYIAQANKFQATRQCNVWTLTTHLGLVG